MKQDKEPNGQPLQAMGRPYTLALARHVLRSAQILVVICQGDNPKSTHLPFIRDQPTSLSPLDTASDHVRSFRDLQQVLGQK